jgi:hypothetical protein
MTTGPEEGTCAHPDEGPDGGPLALPLTEGLGHNAEDVERLRFEAWMGGLQFNLRRHVDRPHQYANASVQGRWVTWQAAAKDTKERCAALVETQDTNGDHVGGWFELLARKIRGLGA